MDIKDTHWIYKGNNYFVISVLKMKHPVSRQWVDAVLYAKTVALKNDNEQYVREYKEFVNLFTQVK